MEDKKIEAVRNWPEPKSVRDIQVFIGFANFYRQFIQGFKRIAISLTSMLKTIESSDSALRLRANNNEVLGGGGKADDRNLSKSKKLKNTKSGKQIRIAATGELTFPTSGTKEAFNQLRQAFTEVLIL